jgi:uncharacterized SAM-binding protein YcdF (DUF218 family)
LENMVSPSSSRLRRKTWRVLLKSALIGLIIWFPLAWLAARLLIVDVQLAHADVIVVLGGSATYKERARAAADHLLKGRGERVLLTNDNLQGPWSSSKQRNLFFYERSLEELAGAGLTSDRIEVLMQPVAGTRDEALVVREYAIAHKVNSLLIVTSAYHSRRALWIFGQVFENSGILIGILPVEPGIETPRTFTWWLSLKGWKLVPTEYIKIVYYAFRYR